MKYKHFIKLITFILSLSIYTTIDGYSGQNTNISKHFHNQGFEINFPAFTVKNIPSTIKLQITSDSLGNLLEGDTLRGYINQSSVKAVVDNGLARFQFVPDRKETLVFTFQGHEYKEPVNPIPLWFSILPPLIAILAALIFKEVFSALFIGIFVGTFTIHLYQGSNFVKAFFQGLFSIIDTYVTRALTDTGHVSIIVFSMLIGAMVSLITRNGGMKGIVKKLSRFARSARSGQFITWLLGISIFFDDYANTLVVGNTMRSVTDRLRISREKLAYIVDSTAAPIASIAFVTTWIGAELSYIQGGINALNIDESPYNVFINSLAYSFYPILTLFFVLFIIWQKKDFGPMLKAEKKAREGGIAQMSDDDSSIGHNLDNIRVEEGVPTRWFNAAIPVLIVIFGTIAGLLYTGWNTETWHDTSLSFAKKLSEIIGNSDSYRALLWSSISGVLVAVLLTRFQKLISLKDTVDSLINGFKTMLTAIVILILAWSIAALTGDLHTADFISLSLIEFKISPLLVPAITFILAALVAFSTGSSWGTMAILYPLILPASWMLSENHGLEYHRVLDIFHNVVASVLAGSVLGDHVSPISDTTILSSLSSSCNLIEHVRTQIPYALTTGFVGIFLGIIPATYGISSWILFPVSISVIYFIIRFIGKRVVL
ncbi:MAG: Na+/H+ antiporter NhaC family protein [Bacteroidales bacterium]